MAVQLRITVWVTPRFYKLSGPSTFIRSSAPMPKCTILHGAHAFITLMHSLWDHNHKQTHSDPGRLLLVVLLPLWYSWKAKVVLRLCCMRLGRGSARQLVLDAVTLVSSPFSDCSGNSPVHAARWTCR